MNEYSLNKSLVASENAYSLKNAQPSQCMPRPKDYTFMWWANGWRGEKIRCYQTGYYGMAMDTINVRMLHLGSIADTRSYEQAVAQDNEVIFHLPSAELRLAIIVGNREYICVGTGRNGRKETATTARLIESGRFLQRGDNLCLDFSIRRKIETTSRICCSWTPTTTL